MQNDVMWRKLIRAWQRNKQFWSQNENSLLQGQKFNSRRLNQLWKAFLSSVVEAETFHCLWRRNLKVHILCNSAIDFFWVVKLSRVPDAQWIGTGFVRRSFIHYFVQCSVFWLCLFTATELSSFVASFETTRNLEISTFLRWLWICCCVVFVCLFFTGLGIIRILSRCWRKIAKIFVRMDTESWKLPLK